MKANHVETDQQFDGADPCMPSWTADDLHIFSFTYDICVSSILELLGYITLKPLSCRTIGENVLTLNEAAAKVCLWKQGKGERSSDKTSPCHKNPPQVTLRNSPQKETNLMEKILKTKKLCLCDSKCDRLQHAVITAGHMTECVLRLINYLLSDKLLTSFSFTGQKHDLGLAQL